MRTIAILRTTSFTLLLLTAGLLHAADTPEAVYQKFHDAMLNGDLDTMLKLSPASIKAEIESSPREETQGMLSMMAQMMPKQFSVLGVVPGANADAVTLFATGMGASMDQKPEKQYGRIAMIKEGGAWTVSEQDWNNQPPEDMPEKSAPAPAAASAAPPVPAAPEPAPAPVAAALVAAVQAAPPPAAPKAPERKKPVCIIKQVMSNAEIDACRQAAAEP